MTARAQAVSPIDVSDLHDDDVGTTADVRRVRWFHGNAVGRREDDESEAAERGMDLGDAAIGDSPAGRFFGLPVTTSCDVAGSERHCNAVVLANGGWRTIGSIHRGFRCPRHRCDGPTPLRQLKASDPTATFDIMEFAAAYR